MFQNLQEAFPPHQSFFQLQIVKNTIYLTLLLSGVSLIAILISDVINQRLSFSFGHEGFNYLFVILKFPLSILATLIPLLAVYAANHRSEQTKENMRLLMSQNNFTNYHRHIELFEKHISEYNRQNLTSKYKPLHAKLFPKPDDGAPTFSICTDYFQKLEASFNSFLKEATLLSNSSSEVKVEAFLKLTSISKELEVALCSSVKSSSGIKRYTKNNTQILLQGDGSLVALVTVIKEFALFTQYIADFSESNVQSAIIDSLATITPNSVSAAFNLTHIIKAPENLPEVKPSEFLEMPEGHAVNEVNGNQCK
ncbi:hypothetical protein [Alteromonas sp. A079]|uniref:hypothetical protein n=1 Tax=Alteromonas sp. A079 TaxID=3410268 RepID=UPI003BA3476C